MSDDATAIELRCGSLLLIIGNEVGITAAELVSTGDQTRLDLRDLPGITSCLEAVETTPRFHDGLFVVGEATATPEMAGEVELHGLEGSAVPAEMQNLVKSVRLGMLAEAASAAWRQRLSDAADSLDPLTGADAEIVGRLDMPGRPLINELRSETPSIAQLRRSPFVFNRWGRCRD